MSEEDLEFEINRLGNKKKKKIERARLEVFIYLIFF